MLIRNLCQIHNDKNEKGHQCSCLKDHHETLKGRRIFVQLVITFRHGSEEEETMGLSFKKELVLDRVQIFPPDKSRGEEETKLQTRLIQKLGDGAYPFSLTFPDLAPNSVIICADENEDPTSVKSDFDIYQ